MIGRQVISAAMTVLLLACPYLECGDCGRADSTQVTATACQHRHDQAAPDRSCYHDPAAPVDHDCPDARDCICNGAIVPDVLRCPEQVVHDGFFAVVADNADLNQSSIAISSHDPWLFRCAHFPPHTVGRDICTLVSSHLL